MIISWYILFNNSNFLILFFLNFFKIYLFIYLLSATYTIHVNYTYNVNYIYNSCQLHTYNDNYTYIMSTISCWHLICKLLTIILPSWHNLLVVDISKILWMSGKKYISIFNKAKKSQPNRFLYNVYRLMVLIKIIEVPKRLKLNSPNLNL